MTKIKLFIAVTIDGFIARENDSLDWLFELPNPNQTDHGYSDFISDIDIIVMGRRTYEEVLLFGIEWPYGNCKSYVVTSNSQFEIKTENTELLNTINEDTISLLRRESNKNIWLVGGGNLISCFLNKDEVDEMTLCLIPVILGKGIRLFEYGVKETKFELIKSESFETGIVNLTYEKK